MRDTHHVGAYPHVDLRTSLRFSASTHKVNVGSSSQLDDLQELTTIQWAWVSSLPGASSESRLWQKAYLGAHSTAHVLAFENYGTDVISTNYSRATSPQVARAAVTNFAAWGLNKWLFVVGRSHATTNGSNNLSIGDLWTPPAEPSAYVDQTAGSGAFRSDAAASLYIGNRENDNVALDGRIAFTAWYNRRLTDSEVFQTWLGWYWHPGLVGLWQHGHMGASRVLDLTGRGSTGTVTGATLSFGPYLHLDAVADSDFRAIAAAAGTGRAFRLPLLGVA